MFPVGAGDGDVRLDQDDEAPVDLKMLLPSLQQGPRDLVKVQLQEL